MALHGSIYQKVNLSVERFFRTLFQIVVLTIL